MNSYKFQKDFAWISRYKFRLNHKQSFSVVAIKALKTLISEIHKSNLKRYLTCIVKSFIAF